MSATSALRAERQAVLRNSQQVSLLSGNGGLLVQGESQGYKVNSNRGKPDILHKPLCAREHGHTLINTQAECLKVVQTQKMM